MSELNKYYEPWDINRSGQIYSIHIDDIYGYQILVQNPHNDFPLDEVAMFNKRVLDCVNAMVGIEDPIKFMNDLMGTNIKVDYTLESISNIINNLNYEI